MVQRFIAFLLLLLHVNSFMLLPQVDEKDACYNGKQADDINSFIEYLEQEVLDIPDASPEDEDDDRGNEFRSLQFGNELSEQKIQLLQINFLENNSSQNFIDKSEKTFLISFDILTPPPKDKPVISSIFE